MEYILKRGEVVSNYDSLDKNGGGRIKVKLKEDGPKSIDEIPDSFPLLPKTINIVPKKGEAVLVVMETLSSGKSQRYYIGPIISQSQYFEKDLYLDGKGSAVSMLPANSLNPLTNISHFEGTKGAFPESKDVAVIGRKSEDVILKDGEIDIRCGIRKPPVNVTKNFKGNVVLNNVDPAYIQLKYQSNLNSKQGQEANSVINIIADKINLIGHNAHNTTLGKSDKLPTMSTDNIADDEVIRNFMDKSHPAVFGDELVKILKIIKSAILFHKHPYPGLSSIKTDYINELISTSMDDILSNNVRLN